ncbi:MAG: phospholipid carrier-dependent glycosyltransferase [Phycisphaerales bacterium]|nr:phospholipid carrier-dependent glycosyltransferase [Phycisphaerales bacterium]
MRAKTITLSTVAVFVLIYLIPLGLRPLVSPDEARYGAIPAGMLASGDWLSPRLGGFHYFEKPPLGYWMTAVSMAVLGTNPFAIRLPMALCAGITALGVALLVSRALSQCRSAESVANDVDIGAQAAPLAALCMLTSLGLVIGGTFAILDVPFTALVTLSIVAFYFAVTSGNDSAASDGVARRSGRVGWIWAAGACCAAAFLTKGLLAIVIPAAAMGPWLAWERRWRDLLIVPLQVLSATAVLAAIPVLLIHRAEEQFWHSFIWIEHFRRFLGGDANQHVSPWWYYAMVLPAALVPWLFAAPMACRGLREVGGCHRSFIRFCCCWIAGPILILSLSSGKLAPYVLPILPPCAVLITLGLLQCVVTPSGLRTGAYRRHLPGAILILVGFAALVTLFTDLPQQIWVDGAIWRVVAVSVALIAWGLSEWWAQAARESSSRVFRMGVSPALLLALAPALLPTALVPDWKTPQRTMIAQRDLLRDAETVVTEESLAHALCLWSGRRDFLLLGAPGEFDNELRMPEEQTRFLSNESLTPTIFTARRRGDVLVVLTDTFIERLMKSQQLPTPTARVHSRDWSILVYSRETGLERNGERLP